MNADTSQNWHVYILKCADGSLYAGSTNDLEGRLKTHNLGKGAKYTRSKLPVRLAFSEVVTDKSSAYKREAEIKKLSRKQKELLIGNYE